MIRDGSTYDTAMPVNRESLDLGGLRKHCKAEHRVPLGAGWPRANLDLAAVHARMHHRYRPSHTHGGLWVLITRPGRSSTVGQISRPMGWYTGQDARPRGVDPDLLPYLVTETTDPEGNVTREGPVLAEAEFREMCRVRDKFVEGDATSGELSAAVLWYVEQVHRERRRRHV